MVSKCANPDCSSTFHYLRDGRLFQIPAFDRAKRFRKNTAKPESSPSRDEFFWLCGDCCKAFTIVFDHEAGAHAVPCPSSQALRAAG